jgi:hypothetical protein
MVAAGSAREVAVTEEAMKEELEAVVEMVTSCVEMVASCVAPLALEVGLRAFEVTAEGLVEECEVRQGLRDAPEVCQRA